MLSAVGFGLICCGSSADEAFSSGLGGQVQPGVSANGLAFAEDGDGLPDLTGQTLEVLLPRFTSDHAAGTTRLVISPEVARLGPVDVFGPTGDFDLSIDGETLVFSGGRATDAAGRTWTSARNTFGKASATTSVFTYSYGVGASPFDSEGVFVTGFETHPDTLAAQRTPLSYDGSWFGYGAVVDGTGTLIQSGVEGGGLISLVADLAGNRVSGRLTGSFFGFADVSGDVSEATVISGGFVSELGNACAGNNDCASATAVAGRFYGANAEDISGLIAFDETRRSDGQVRTLLAPAGFTAQGNHSAGN